MSATSASQRTEISCAFLSRPERRLENVTWRLILFSILFNCTLPLPISSLSLSSTCSLSLSLSSLCVLSLSIIIQVLDRERERETMVVWFCLTRLDQSSGVFFIFVDENNVFLKRSDSGFDGVRKIKSFRLGHPCMYVKTKQWHCRRGKVVSRRRCGNQRFRGNRGWFRKKRCLTLIGWGEHVDARPLRTPSPSRGTVWPCCFVSSSNGKSIILQPHTYTNSLYIGAHTHYISSIAFLVYVWEPSEDVNVRKVFL